MQLDHSFGSNECVDLSSTDTSMSQQRLDNPQICAGIQQVGGKCVPNALRAERPDDAVVLGMFSHDQSKCARV